MQYKFTRDSVAVMLDQLSGNTFIGLTTETTPKLKGGKKNPLQGRITKRTVSVVQIFTNQNGSAYAKMGVSSRAAATLFAMEHGMVTWGELPSVAGGVQS